MSSIIMVVTGEHTWTLQALHLAAAMARETGASLLLVEMVRVGHVEYLGAGLREVLLPYERLEALRNYTDAVRGYGIPITVAPFEYLDYTGGLLSAAEQSEALAVFAPAPAGLRPLAAARLWRLRRALRRPFYTLGAGDGAAVWSLEQPAAETKAPAPAAASFRS